MSDMKHYTLTVREVLQSLSTLAMQYEEVSRGASPTGNYFFAVNVADVAASLKAAQALILQLPYWIPVSERMPEEGVVVLAFLPKQRGVESGVYAAVLSELQTLKGTFSTSFGFGFDATHWMPLPQPPLA